MQDPFIIKRDNTSYHYSQQTKELIKKNKLKEILDWSPNSHDLNPERLGNNKGELQKENISKRSILINRIKEIYENIPYKYIENIVKSFVTRLQRCIKLEGNRTGY